MDVKVTSTGKIFYQVDPTLCAILLEMFPAAIERINPRPAPKPEDSIAAWGISVTLSGYHYVVFKLGSWNVYYDGPPSQLAAYFAKSGVVVPDHIVKQYTPLWRWRPELTPPSLHNTYAAEYTAIHNKERK